MGKKRIGILTSGGDCAGLNAVIRAAVHAADERDWEVLGIEDGTAGLLDRPVKVAPQQPDDRREAHRPLQAPAIAGIGEGGPRLVVDRAHRVRVEAAALVADRVPGFVGAAFASLRAVAA